MLYYNRILLTFLERCKKMIHKAFLECIEKGCLSPTMRTGVITVLPKPNKDLMKLDNWRQITLLCNHYKLLVIVYADWLKHVLAKLVEEFQSAFIKGRHIRNNVILVLDMIDYQSFIDSESFILFIDLFKAFSSKEHVFWSKHYGNLVLVISFVELLKYFTMTSSVIFH